MVGKVLKLLNPFEEITRITSSSCSSVSEGIPNLKPLPKYPENSYNAISYSFSRRRMSIPSGVIENFEKRLKLTLKKSNIFTVPSIKPTQKSFIKKRVGLQSSVLSRTNDTTENIRKNCREIPEKLQHCMQSPQAWLEILSLE